MLLLRWVVHHEPHALQLVTNTENSISMQRCFECDCLLCLDEWQSLQFRNFRASPFALHDGKSLGVIDGCLEGQRDFVRVG